MINKEQLLKQPTKLDREMKSIEYEIDKELKQICPETIDGKFTIYLELERYGYEYKRETVEKVIEKYKEEGGYEITYEIRDFFRSSISVDITFHF